MCWDVVDLASLAVPQISGRNGRADKHPLQPKRAICSWGNHHFWLFKLKKPGPRLQCTIGNTEFILFPPPVRTHRLGLKRAFRMNNGWKTLPFQQWEMWNSTPTLTHVTREPSCVLHQYWDTSQAIICTQGLSLNLKNHQKSQRGVPPHPSSLRNKEHHILPPETVCGSDWEWFQAHSSFRHAIDFWACLA